MFGASGQCLLSHPGGGESGCTMLAYLGVSENLGVAEYPLRLVAQQILESVCSKGC